MKNLTSLPLVSALTLLGLSLLFSGCRTTPDRSAPEGEAIEPIGRIVYVYPREDLTIVRLNPGARISEDSLWLVVNPSGRPTAMIRSTDTRRGRTMGFLIDEGLPNPGDNVFRKLEE